MHKMTFEPRCLYFLWPEAQWALPYLSGLSAVQIEVRFEFFVEWQPQKPLYMPLH